MSSGLLTTSVAACAIVETTDTEVGDEVTNPLVALAAMVTFLPGCAYLSRASESTTGVQADASSGAPSLSADGRWIAFHSTATNLVAGDTNGVP